MPLSADESSRADYTFSARLLHRLALGLPSVSKASFDIDGLFHDNHQKSEKGGHVFICGLARVGTTILMRTFYQTGQFRSLTYRDMPFVLMPRIWRQLAKTFYKAGTPQHRVQGDRIIIDYDSPEAFEEVFWRTYAGRHYILDDQLIPHVVDEELIQRFRLYVGRIISSTANVEQNRYLSKNNNNILRLPSIRKAFPNSLVIVLFRDPIQQAASLWEQHKQFCKRQRNDKFSYDYMRWLGHHEYGLTHKPFYFGTDERNFKGVQTQDDFNYWLDLWVRTYSYLLNTEPKSSVFVCYEDLCNSSEETVSSLFELSELPIEAATDTSGFMLPVTKKINEADTELENTALEIYGELRRKGA